jgi:hypothetical protein
MSSNNSVKGVFGIHHVTAIMATRKRTGDLGLRPNEFQSNCFMSISTLYEKQT